jgi:hypothetical protein
MSGAPITRHASQRGLPNKAVEPIAYSLRFAPASGNGSCLAFGPMERRKAA